MMGTALIDLYSSNYQESTSRKPTSTNDGNGNAGTIVRNKRPIIKDKKLSGLRAILFDSSQSKNESNYHTLSGFTNGELLVNISEEEEKTPNDEQAKECKEGVDKRSRSGQEFCKSSSDGCKIRPALITQVPAGGSMQVLSNGEIRSRQRSASGNQIDFGKVIARFPMIYVGQKFLDKKYTLPMLPWLVAEFRREVLPIGNSPGSSNLSFNSSSSAGSNSFVGLGLQGPFKRERKRVWFEISDRCVLGFDRQQSGFDELNKSFTADSEKEAFSRMNALNEGYLFLHKNNWICKVQEQPHEDGDLFCFVYLTRDFGHGFGQNNENKPYTLHVFECDEKQIVSVHVSVCHKFPGMLLEVRAKNLKSLKNFQ